MGKISNILKKFKWVWIALITLSLTLYFFTKDDNPNSAYLALTDLPSVDKKSWNNFLQMKAIRINSPEPEKQLERYIDAVHNVGLDSAKSVLIENGPLLNFPRYYDWELCEKKEESIYYVCLDSLLKNKEFVLNSLSGYDVLLDRIDRLKSIKSAKADYFKLNRFGELSHYDDMGTSILFDLDDVDFTIRNIQYLKTFYHLEEFSFDLNYCKQEFQSAIMNSFERIKNSNELHLLVSELTGQDIAIDIANYLINKKPELAECFIELNSVTRDAILGSKITLNAVSGERLLFGKQNLQEAAKKNLERSSYLLKIQKTLNIQAQYEYDASEYYGNSSRPYDELDYPDFEYNVFENWNNFVGYLMLKVAMPQAFDFSEDIEWNVAEAHLTAANAALKKCEYEQKRSCSKVLENYPDPFTGDLPVLDQDKATLSYWYPSNSDPKSISVPTK